MPAEASLAALTAVVGMQTAMTRYANDQRLVAVYEARSAGASWRQIAAALKMPVSTAYRRYGYLEVSEL